jgi:nitroreductase
VPDEAVRALIDAAVHAPTAIHAEPWAFAIVQDRAEVTIVAPIIVGAPREWTPATSRKPPEILCWRKG